MGNDRIGVSIYKGENRFLIIPEIRHIGGFSVESQWYKILPLSTEYEVLGECIGDAIKHAMYSEPSAMTPIERKENATWKNGSKYKSWLSFWKNNLLARVDYSIEKGYNIYSTERTEDVKGGYCNCIRRISLENDSSQYEIGKAIKDVLDAADLFYKGNNRNIIKQIQLLNNETLNVQKLEFPHFEEDNNIAAMEIYLCYSYILNENEDPLADIFIGIAPELDGDTSVENIRSTWEKIYGKADLFAVQDVKHGIFNMRVEMKNKNTHRISYMLQMEDDLLLECGLEIHQPNSRKKIDEKLVQVFETFASGCSF